MSQDGAASHALQDTEDLIAAACQLPPLKEDERRRVLQPVLSGGEEAMLQRLRYRCWFGHQHAAFTRRCAPPTPWHTANRLGASTPHFEPNATCQCDVERE